MIDLSSIKPSITFKPPKIVIYGPSGIGKSTFASQAPNPIVIDIERGMDLINVAKYPVKTFKDVLEIITTLTTQKHDFEYIIIDSIDWLERIMIQNLCDANKAKTINDANCKAFSFGRGEKLLMTLWEQFISSLNALHYLKNMGIILIAHNQITKFNDPVTESYDKHSLKLEKKSCEFIKEWAECVLFADLKVKIEEEELGFNKSINRGKELGRVLYTEKRPAFEAKNRYNLPPEIEFSWKGFIRHLDKRYSDLKSNSFLNKNQIEKIRELLKKTDTDEDTFVHYIINNKDIGNLEDVKLENIPSSGFEEMERLLLKKMEKFSKPPVVNGHYEGATQ